MDKSVWIAVLVCLALVACEPRGPQKPKTVDDPILPVAGAAAKALLALP